MIEKKDKEIYMLWWQYLQHSEKYKQFCNWWKNGGKKQIPKSLKQYHQSMWNTYVQFGDVHNEFFEEWWHNELENPLPCPYYPYYPGYGKNMIDYRSVIGKDIYEVHRKFKKEHGREPNINELILNLELHMNFWDKERLYLLVEFQHAPNAEIIKEFHDFLNDKKKEPSIKETSRSIKGMKGVTTIKKQPSTAKELKRYLKAYDYCKEGHTYSEIAELMWTILDNDDGDDCSDDTERIVKRDILKAKKIISNVECGYFPGQF